MSDNDNCELSFSVDATPRIEQNQETPFAAQGGMVAEVTGVRVIRNGQIIKEWHRDELARNYADGNSQFGD